LSYCADITVKPQSISQSGNLEMSVDSAIVMEKSEKMYKFMES